MSASLQRASMSFVDFDGHTELLAYHWVLSDGGRATSRRPAQRNDCTVRALVIARGLSYDGAYDCLKAAGRKCSRGFDFARWMSRQTWATKLSFPARKGERCMTLAAFCGSHPEGTFIVRVAKHVLAVKDGVAYDSFENRPDRCVYCAWAVL